MNKLKALLDFILLFRLMSLKGVGDIVAELQRILLNPSEQFIGNHNRDFCQELKKKIVDINGPGNNLTAVRKLIREEASLKLNSQIAVHRHLELEPCNWTYWARSDFLDKLSDDEYFEFMDSYAYYHYRCYLIDNYLEVTDSMVAGLTNPYDIENEPKWFTALSLSKNRPLTMERLRRHVRNIMTLGLNYSHAGVTRHLAGSDGPVITDTPTLEPVKRRGQWITEQLAKQTT